MKNTATFIALLTLGLASSLTHAETTLNETTVQNEAPAPDAPKVVQAMSAEEFAQQHSKKMRTVAYCRDGSQEIVEKKSTTACLNASGVKKFQDEQVFHAD